MQNNVIRISLIALLAGTLGVEAVAQDATHHVIDFVDLPVDFLVDLPVDFLADLTGYGAECELKQTWYIKFQEHWNILPHKSHILKSVMKYSPLIHNAPLASTDTLQQRFTLLIGQLPVEKGTIRWNNISYEFMLLDPHLTESGNRAFPEPDSMDVWTRKLQSDLIALIQSRSLAGKQYDYSDQLLSVLFHEDWMIDPVTREIDKKVVGITPVIWQRRKTTSGEPVNDAETGLPVYYKNRLHRIDLRNP